MSLTSSLFTGTSGLTNMGNAMQVIGDNVANVNTVGFKGNRYTFADLLSQSVATQSGTAQVGRGMALGSVDSTMSQGSFETTGNTTDLSIGGDGFFVLRKANSEQEFYTRAGNFNFDKDGYLVNPEGYIVQGWALDPETGDDQGAVTDILLRSFTSPPKQTDQIQVMTNLDADAVSQTAVLPNVWDATQETPLGPTNYEYQTVVKAYDSLGSTHDLTIYYDKKDGSEWEYLITANPNEDQRNLVQNTTSQGLVARGVITFSDSSGTVSNISMEQFTGRVNNLQTNGSITPDTTTVEINNYDVFTQDYHDIGLEYDGTTWSFSNYFGRLDPPYNEATVTGDANNIFINLDNDTAGVTDMTITFSAPAQPFDSISFNLNDPDRLHVQGLNNTRYLGATANDNTTLSILNPEVMTDDALNNLIEWNAAGIEPFWSWGNIHNMENFTGAVAPTNTRFSISDTSVLIDTTANFQMSYDGTGTGGWSIAVDPGDYAAAAIVSGDENSVIVRLTDAGGNTTDLEYQFISPLGTGGAGDAGTFEFNTHDEIRPVGYTPDQLSHFGLNNVAITDFTYGITNRNLLVNAGPFGFQYDGTGAGGWTFTAGSDPSAAGPYANPGTVIAGDETNMTITLDDGSGSTATLTYTFNPPLGTGGAANAIDMDFSTAVYTPDAYANAAISGDRDKALVDLNNDGTDDFRFDFTDPLTSGAGVGNSTIQFDIEGNTAWTAQQTNDSGYYEFMTDFLGGQAGATQMNIEFNIGAQDDGTGQFVNDSLSSTQYARSSTTTFQSANGYGAGDLQGVDVATDGEITGIYSNGQLIPLFRVALADFLNVQGLFKNGGNLYRETRDSGTAITNKPGTNGLGSLSPNSLEMSNVDISTEFVKMITTQRGFQANSKIVTTVDTMLGEVIQMKR